MINYYIKVLCINVHFKYCSAINIKLNAQSEKTGQVYLQEFLWILQVQVVLWVQVLPAKMLQVH